MHRRLVHTEPEFTTRRSALVVFAAMGLCLIAPSARAQTTLGPVTLGAGFRTSYVRTDADGGNSVDQFFVNDARLYVNGPVTDKIKFMFNTDYDGATNHLAVLDAVARIELSPKFNIWAGRFLEPSDRANLYGPFYSQHWNVYRDAIQDGYKFVFQGRDNGVAYWGNFGKKVQTKVSIGAFDGSSATGNPDVLGAARVQFDFWDHEDGYYLNGTYYGDKNVLAIGGASQVQSGKVASTIDFLMERKLGNGSAFSLEGEYANYNGLGGYLPNARKSQGAYGLASYLLPKMGLSGNFEIVGKYAYAGSHGQKIGVDQKTTEINVNYVLKRFNVRFMNFYKNTRYNKFTPNFWTAGIGLQIQM